MRASLTLPEVPSRGAPPVGSCGPCCSTLWSDACTSCHRDACIFVSLRIQDATRLLNMLLPELRAPEPAAGLRRNISNAKVVDQGTLEDDRLRRL